MGLKIKQAVSDAKELAEQIHGPLGAPALVTDHEINMSTEAETKTWETAMSSLKVAILARWVDVE